MRYIDWIWRIRGTLALAVGQSNRDAFERLDPLFRKPNTSYRRSGDELTFEKKDQAAQDKMSIFDHGVLRIEREPTGSVLRYDLTSRALLFCFLAPLLFLGIAQVTKMLAVHEKAKTEAAGKTKEPDKKDVVLPMNPIDKFLGAPAPEKPKKKPKNDPDGGGKGKLSPTPAYVFAGIFLVLYVVGRILEARLARSLFRKALSADP